MLLMMMTTRSQIRELNGEIEELQNNRVHEHVITKAESRAKELENALRAEERYEHTPAR